MQCMCECQDVEFDLQTMLHTGDLRWSHKMAEHAALRNQRIDLLFLDTTYAKPNHTHPPQVCP